MMSSPRKRPNSRFTCTNLHTIDAQLLCLTDPNSALGPLTSTYLIRIHLKWVKISIKDIGVMWRASSAQQGTHTHLSELLTPISLYIYSIYIERGSFLTKRNGGFQHLVDMTLFIFITMLCGTDNIPHNITWMIIPGNIKEYFMEYYQSYLTLSWI